MTPMSLTLQGNQHGLIELAAACEVATGESRELDCSIWFTIHPDKEVLWGHSGMNAQREQFKERDLFAAFHRDPNCYGFRDRDHSYTSSIDAALTLVPEGRAIRREYLPSASWPHRVWIYRDSIMPIDDGSRRPVLGRTEALALCAAALKARAALGSKGEAVSDKP